MTKKPTWGGQREGAGRLPKHDKKWKIRTIAIKCTDEEWAAFKAKLPSDNREKYKFFMAAIEPQG